ncbi:FtsX-like permease family protein [Tissierella sp.]|uniref:ABC transporter permease n=1 Tax=Tissierella sp. TaxID=41274 RepID=UPI00285DFE89|nr:FtsX-like permease family protein [Tissierella sp.]MDR7855755.1 FtsX-like permease family protein [Tissierella sp.]
MKIWDIARRGLKGRKKDTLLLKLVITLAFIFIVTSTIFEASIGKTKSEQLFDLYGEWHAAYLGGNQETLEKLKAEPNIDKLGSSLIIGESDKTGVVGTFNQDLIDMGRLSLYKGTYPQADNEIMLELNQMSNMGLELEVGQTVQIAITIPRSEADPSEYILNLNKKFYERKKDMPRPAFYDELDEIYKELDMLYASNPEDEEELQKKEARINELENKRSSIYGRYYNEIRMGRPDYYNHHETPFEQSGDVYLVVSNDYFFYYLNGDEVNPEIIREKGLLRNQKIVLKKEFVVTGILQTYTDKWDLGVYKSPNAFITEGGGKSFTDALYGSSLGDFSDYKLDYNIFLHSSSLKEELYSSIVSNYPNIETSPEKEKVIINDVHFWMNMYGRSDEEIEKSLENMNNYVSINRKPEDWMDNSIEGKVVQDSKMEVNTDNFRRNIFSYPEDTVSTENVLTLTIIAVIFIATALAIFQIFLTQMKRRSRKIILLKSIGATNLQIVKTLIWEGLYLLQTGLLIGIPSGFALSAIIIFGMNAFGGRNLHYHVIPSFLILGIIAGCMALFIGMAVPMIFAIRIPLVGTMSKPPKHKKIKRKSDNKEIRRQTFRYINWKNFQLNKGKSFISFGISLVIITILLSTILLSYYSFNNYRTKVIANNQPDYAMETYFGETTRHIKAIEAELKEIDGIESVEYYKVGKQTFLWYDGIENNKIIESYRQLLPSKLSIRHFSSYNEDLLDEPEWIKNAFFTKIYGIDPKGEIFDSYNSMLTEGTINREKFEKGEDVILLIPMYLPGKSDIGSRAFTPEEVLAASNENNRMNWILNNANIYNTSYNSRFNKYYYKQNDIKIGDSIYLSADEEKIDGDSYVISHKTKEVTVGGFIYYFPKEGQWPFSNTVDSHIVIGSINCMESIYPSSMMGLSRNSLDEMRAMIDVLYPNRYGRTIWYINTNSDKKDLVMDAKLLGYANNNGYTVYNYKNSAAQLHQEAFNNALIIALLGITSAAIASIILYNTTVSKMEQDKNRIGILQSLGVTRSEFSSHYIYTGVIHGVLAILIANLALLIVLFLTSLASVGGINMTFADSIMDIFAYRLWQYPWTLHIIGCGIFFLLTVLMHYLPSRKIINLYPVENIRSLGR